MNVDDEYGSVHWQTATDLESSRSEQDTDPFASFDVQKPSITRNVNGFDTHTASTSDYDHDTFIAKTSPDSLSKSNDTDAANDSQFVALPMSVTVTEPQKESEGSSGTYISYLITTHTSIPTFSSRSPCRVRRRYQDFVWLHNALTYEYSASIVPPLPEKHRIEYLKGDRFGSEFVERRRQSLQWFLDRIARHPLYQQSQNTRVFLESANFKHDKQLQAIRDQSSGSVIETISDTFLNAFTKVQKPEERFVDMKENVDKLADNLNTVERLYSRISKRQQDLAQDYTMFANSIDGLSNLETGISSQLGQFAETSRKFSGTIKEMCDKEDLMFLNEVHEYLAYCQSAKATLRARDQKQVDFEELSNYLQDTIAERERTMYPGRKLGDRPSVNITAFLADKVKEVRGVDMVQAKQEKLERLEHRITELQDEVAKSNDISNMFSNQVMKEFQVFEKAKSVELRNGLLSYADSHIDFFKQGASIWSAIIPILEATEVPED
ncbi:intercellular trafficking and secretion [Umbelopsis nana]